MRVASIDIGTNTVLLTIVEGSGPGDTTVLEERAEIVRLGEGLDRTGTLAAPAIVRTLGVLADYVVRIGAHEVDRTIAVATEAVRKASNGETFVNAADQVLGAVGGAL